MFDRILHLIDVCVKDGTDRQLADDAVTYYMEQGGAAAEKFLITEKKISPEQAAALLARIDKENYRLNRVAFAIVFVYFFASLLLFVSGGLETESYFFMFVGGINLIISGILVRKRIRRLWFNARYAPAKNGLHQKDPGR